MRQRKGFGRGFEQEQNRIGGEPADDRDDHRKQRREPDCAARGAARGVNIAASDRLPDQYRRGHTETEKGGEHQEHDDVGVGGRGERAVA